MQDEGGQSTLRSSAGEAAQVTHLEQSLWRRLSQAEALGEAAAAWAPLMHRRLERAELVAVFLTDPEGGRMKVAAGFPEARVTGGALISAAEDAVSTGRGVVRGAVNEAGQPTGGLVAVAAPLIVEGSARGAVGLEIVPADQAEMRDAMRQLQWGAAWIRDALRREAAGAAALRYDHAIKALNSVVGVAEKDDIATATRAATTDLAARFDCDRVSLGFRRSFRTKVVAMSNAAQFGKRMKLTRMIAAAMDEAIDQRGPVLWPETATDTPMATHRHEKLGRAQAIGHILTVPLYAIDRFAGAITFERPEDRPFTQDDVEILEAITTVLAPIVEEKRRNDRWLIAKAWESLVIQLKRLFGPNHLGRKLALIAVMCLTAFFLVAKGEDRVSADSVIEGALQRTIAAPFDGFLAESFARAGDEVVEGQILARLDDRELALERLRLVTELQSARIEYDRALAERDRAETQLRRSEIAQAEAEIALIDRQMERTRLLAPFDGLVTSGDLSQSIGASVARGEPLFTVSPAGDHRVILQVDERRIADVELGQTGALVATALPERSFDLEVTKITPVAQYADGTTTFRVEAALTGAEEGLRPGMEGVAKIDTGEALLISIWTRPVRDWFSLWAWRWLSLGE